MPLTFDDRATALLEPAREVLVQAVARLPEAAPLHVAVGDWVSGFYELQGGTLVLSSGLEGPAMHHPDERVDGPEPLDRWRRAVASVIEGLVLHILQERHGGPVPREWLAVGFAVDQADKVAPELRLALPDVAAALLEGQPGRDPRQGVMAIRAWRALGVEPLQRVLEALGDRPVTATEWVELGAWVMGPEGSASAPMSVQRRAPLDIPVRLGPWEWARLAVPAHPRGGHVRAVGGAHAHPSWAVGGKELIASAGSTGGGGELLADVGGPVGSWEQLSAAAYGQVFGSRGVTYGFRGDGTLQIVLADAFVGPLAALDVAKTVGHSGVLMGRWSVAGPSRLAVRDIVGSQVTTHGRDESPFVVPTGSSGLAQALRALEESPWDWRVEGRELVMEGRLGGGAVVIRFRKV